MTSLNLITDVLAIKITKNFIFAGIGCILHVMRKNDHEIARKINCLHPDNIHGIEIKDNEKLIVFGGKSLIVFKVDLIHQEIKIEKLTDIQLFDDWIIDVKWLGNIATPILSILLAHNTLSNFLLFEKKQIRFTCKELCLLYSGTISGKNSDEAVIFSGTVFQEILIWKLTRESKIYADVLFRLKGHKVPYTGRQGVIFSIFYSPAHNLICSTSDDRTVRLWKVSNKSICNDSEHTWKNCDITLDTVMYGHLARVWRAILFNDRIASIGEDSNLCIWNLEGKVLRKFKLHHGAPIWCIDISDDNILFTGGGDGSIQCTPVLDVTSDIKLGDIIQNQKSNVPKWVSFADSNSVLIISKLNHDTVLSFLELNTGKIFYNSLEYCSTGYCIIEMSSNKNLIAIGSINGEVVLYKKISKCESNFPWEKYTSYKAMNSKILSLKWINNDSLLLCGEEGIILMINIQQKEMRKTFQCILPESRERWVTSACVYKTLLICADRMGSIYVYQLNGVSEDPIQAFKKIHGKFGVQSCQIIDSKLISTGRDGTVKLYHLDQDDTDRYSVQYLYAKTMSMDWVSRVIKMKSNYMVLGFKEEEFIIHNLNTDQTINKIACGGGHRSWDCEITETYIRLLYIQKKKVYISEVPIIQLYCSPFLGRFHVKVSNCLKFISVAPNYYITVSGGEDCILRVNTIGVCSQNCNDLKITKSNSFDGHLSSIKCIDYVTVDRFHNSLHKEYLIFSGGGRAQLKVWNFMIRMKETSCANDVIFKDLSSYMLYGCDDKRNKIWIGKELMYSIDPETRFMDLCTLSESSDQENIYIFIACSDGYIRVVLYQIKTCLIKLVCTKEYEYRCILKMHLLRVDGKIILLSMATDGFLCFWNVVINHESVDLYPVSIDKELKIGLHQSSINSSDIIQVDRNYLLTTGGDDNCLHLLKFSVEVNNDMIDIRKIWTWKSTAVHYAQITGLKFVGNQLISVGADQKLAIHSSVQTNPRLVHEETFCIADVQGVEYFEINGIKNNYFCVYGHGLQILQLPIK